MDTYVLSGFHSTIELDTPEDKNMIIKMVASLADNEQFNIKQENIIEFCDNL